MTIMTKEALHTIVQQHWIESERRMGTKPDGDSLHFSLEDRNKFVREYWDSMPAGVPDVYSKPQGDPVLAEVEHTVFKRLKKAKKDGKSGIRVYRG